MSSYREINVIDPVNAAGPTTDEKLITNNATDLLCQHPIPDLFSGWIIFDIHIRSIENAQGGGSLLFANRKLIGVISRAGNTWNLALSRVDPTYDAVDTALVQAGLVISMQSTSQGLTSLGVNVTGANGYKNYVTVTAHLIGRTADNDG